MQRSETAADRTAVFVLVHGGWRVLLTLMVVTVPLYGWVLFYYLATGAWHQSVDVVRMGAPLLATFLIPLLLGSWIIGFRKWRIVIGALAAAIIASWIPGATLATKILPNSYINLAIVLVLLMIGIRIFRFWRDHHIHKLPVASYSRVAMAIVAATTVCSLTFLLPTSL